jgi:hypothetical protein
MPPRFAYWTIILDGVPTSFRAREQAEILPTFKQLKKKNPGAQLKWFSGGKLWDSPDQAREERQLERVREFRAARSKHPREERARDEDALAEFRRQHGRPADGSDDRAARKPAAHAGPGPQRERDQERRPRGEHKGPRDKFQRPPGKERAREEDPLAEFRRQHGRPADGSDDRAAQKPAAHATPRPQRDRDQDRRPRGEHKGPRDKFQRPPGQARPREEDPLAEFRKQHGRPADRSGDRAARKPAARAGSRPPRDRGKDWRPGGDHKDPRDKYKLPPGEARKRWKKRHLGGTPGGPGRQIPPSTSVAPKAPLSAGRSRRAPASARRNRGR